LAGIEVAQYDVTDISLVGNFSTGNVGYLFGELKYKFPVTKNISLNPKLSMGYTWMQQLTGHKDFGMTEGIAYTIGITADYRIYKRFRVFTGIDYRLSIMNMDTDPEYESF